MDRYEVRTIYVPRTHAGGVCSVDSTGRVKMMKKLAVFRVAPNGEAHPLGGFKRYYHLRERHLAERAAQRLNEQEARLSPKQW